MKRTDGTRNDIVTAITAAPRTRTVGAITAAPRTRTVGGRWSSFVSPALLLMGTFTSHCSDSSSALTAPPGPAGQAATFGDAEVSARTETANIAISDGNYIASEASKGSFALVTGGKAAPLVVSESDWVGVRRAAGDLQADIERVSSAQPTMSTAVPAGARLAVLIGTVGKSPLVDELVRSNKLDVSSLKNGTSAAWETFLIQVVDKPMSGVDQALVIAGSDKRGTIFGVYDVSRRIGVSPWYFWSDVPPQKHPELHARSGRFSQGTPAVKYRGFFINDENPQTGSWARRLFGDSPGSQGHVNPGAVNHAYYAKIYEVLLRLRGNYLWPAEWGQSLWIDDPASAAEADEYGVVLGTPHDAPMMRATQEWSWFNGSYVPLDPGAPAGDTSFSFRRHPNGIQQYFRDGIERTKNYEFVASMGMRGTNDTGLVDGEALPLMEQIYTAEQQILASVTGKDLADIPQSWDLYREVQRYWNNGMRPPGTITVMFCDDNWGNLRKLPPPAVAPPGMADHRPAGYGIYYHLDFVGGPRNYKWADTTLLPNMWEQLNLAYTGGVDRMFMLNVGDMKDDERPLQFFLDFAWAPGKLPLEAIESWNEEWTAQQFGQENAATIAGILHDYSRLQSVRKPEMSNMKAVLAPAVDYAVTPPVSANISYVDDTPFSLTNYRELETLTAQWADLAARAVAAGKLLPDELQDAYYELVAYKVEASANLYALRLAQFKGILYHAQGRAANRDRYAEAWAHFADNQAYDDRYNTVVAGGKWAGWATQPKLGYHDVTRLPAADWWQQPESVDRALPDHMSPPIPLLDVSGAAPQMGVAVEGSTTTWSTGDTAFLPTFERYQTQPVQYVEVFNRGAGSFTFTAESTLKDTDPNGPFPLVFVTPSSGTLDEATKELRLSVTVDWPRVANAPFAPSAAQLADIPITISGNGQSVVVHAKVHPDFVPLAEQTQGAFVEANGTVSMEAAHYTRSIAQNGLSWTRIPEVGRLCDGMKAAPNDAPRLAPGGDSPRLEYDFYQFSDVTTVTVQTFMSPRIATFYRPDLSPPDADGTRHPDERLLYAVSIDDAPPKLVDAYVNSDLTTPTPNRVWELRAGDNISRGLTSHAVSGRGKHTLKLWMVDPTVIAQKLVIDTDKARESYFGPPESFRLSQ